MKNPTPRYFGNKIEIHAIPLKNRQFSFDGYALYLPERLSRHLQVKKEAIRMKAPLKSIHLALQALLTDLIYLNPDAEKNMERPWMISEYPVETGHISRFIEEWYLLTFKEAIPEYLLNELEWVPYSWTFAYDVNDTGTASVSDPLAFQLMTLLVAEKMAGEFQVECLGEKVHFYPVHNGNYAELIQWPPYKKENGYLSYRVTLTLQNIPFVPHPYIYLHVGLARWVKGKKVKPNKNRKSFHVYLKEQFPWSIGLGESRFTKFTVEKINDLFFWGNRVEKLLEKTGFGSLLPKAQDWINSPEEYLVGGIHNCIIAVPHGNHLENKTGIKQGAGARERYEISCLLTKKLGEASFPIVHEIKVKEPKKNESLHLVLPEEICFELHYQDEKWLDVTHKALLEEMEDCEYLGDNLYRWKESTVRIIDRNIEMKLYLPPKASEDRVKQFVNDFTENLPLPKITTACLFELGDKDQFNYQTDPKHSIRHAFALSDRLVQMITPIDEKKSDIRFNKAVRDLFRQLGGSKEKLAALGKEGTSFLGIYVPSRNRKTNLGRKKIQIPLFTLVNEGNTYIRTPYNGWLPYREGLLSLSKDAEMIEMDEANVESFVRRTLAELQHLDHVIAFAHAQNARGLIKWLGNQNIHQPNRAFHVPNLSFVRVRNEERYEAPEWALHGIQKLKGKATHDSEQAWPQATKKGFYQLNDRVFFSVAPKPSTYQTVNSLTKYETNDYRRVETALEVVVPFVKAGEQVVEVAKYAHILRNGMNFQYDEFTILPFPLHLAKKAKEYLFTLDNEDEEIE